MDSAVTAACNDQKVIFCSSFGCYFAGVTCKLSINNTGFALASARAVGISDLEPGKDFGISSAVNDEKFLHPDTACRLT